MKWRAFIAVASCLVMAGCGGQGSSTSGGEGSNHSTNVGIASIQYKGEVVPASSFSQSGVTVTSMAGASFTNVALTPAPKKENSVLVFAMGGEIWTYQNGVQTQITNTKQSFGNPTVSKFGQVAFSGIDFATNEFQLFGCNLDGSNFHRITSSNQIHNHPSFSPSGTKIVFSGDDGIFTVGSDGSSETLLSVSAPNLEATNVSNPSWSPDGTMIVFDGFDANVIHYEIYTVAAAGGSATEQTSAANDFSQPRWSPNGTTLAYAMNASGSIQIDYSDIRQTNSQATLVSPPSGTNYLYPCFTPDGNSITFESLGTSQNAIDSQIISSPSSLTSIISYPTAQSPLSPFWSPYFGAKTFIGTGGEMATAGGFVWGQVGDGFGGFASFAATTPTTLTITQQNAGTTNSAFVFLAKADKITKIVYSNSYFGAYNALTPTNSKQALISVSSTTGQIDTIAPLAHPGLSRSTRGGLGYDGEFAAIYDAKGKNLAPNGAEHIELDSKTGAVSSWR